MTAISRRAYAAMGIELPRAPMVPERTPLPPGFADGEELMGVLADVYDLVAHAVDAAPIAVGPTRPRPDDLLAPSFPKR